MRTFSIACQMMFIHPFLSRELATIWTVTAAVCLVPQIKPKSGLFCMSVTGGTGTQTHMCTDVSPTRVLVLHEPEVIFLLWWTQRQDEVSRAGQPALQHYNAFLLNRLQPRVSHKSATRKIIQLQNSFLVPHVCHHLDEVGPTEWLRWSKSLFLPTHPKFIQVLSVIAIS